MVVTAHSDAGSTDSELKFATLTYTGSEFSNLDFEKNPPENKALSSFLHREVHFLNSTIMMMISYCIIVSPVDETHSLLNNKQE